MRYTKILIYLLYVLVLLGSLAAAGWGFFTIKVWIGRHYRPLPGMAGYCLICIVIGLLLGLEHFLKEFRKQGRWTVNLIRLVIMGIPSGISAFYLVLSFALLFFRIDRLACVRSILAASSEELIFLLAIITSKFTIIDISQPPLDC